MDGSSALRQVTLRWITVVPEVQHELEQELNGEMYSAQVFGKDDSWHIFDSALGLVAKGECFSLNQVLEMFDNLSHEGDRS